MVWGEQSSGKSTCLNNHFKLKENTPFIGIYNGVVSIEDFNGDGYLDVLMVGEKYIMKRVARLYLNDGKGDFIEKTDRRLKAANVLPDNIRLKNN